MSAADPAPVHVAPVSLGPLPHGIVLPRTAAPPTMRLAALLAQAGEAVLAGLPARVWVEATVLAVRPGAHGHSLELADGEGGRGGEAAQLPVVSYSPAASSTCSA